MQHYHTTTGRLFQLNNVFINGEKKEPNKSNSEFMERNVAREKRKQ